ncbi:MAG: threonine synthase [Candidatus Methylomirabilales bacterium]
MGREESPFAVGAACTACGRAHELGRIYRCETCDGPLDILYDYAAIPQDSFDPARGARAEGIWVHRNLLPVAPAHIVTLGEGHSPLLRCDRLGARLGLSSLWVKDETRHPTGSFKDRPLSVAISKARELAADTVVTASSGNAAASMSAYAARAGLRGIVFVPANTPPSKLLQIAAMGACVVRIKGSVSDCIQLTQAAAREFGWYNVTTTFENPYSVEGDKTVAYEIAAQLGWRCPRWIVVPTGAGPLPVAIWKGFVEMQRVGLVQATPRLVAAQAAGCAPIARAFQAGDDIVKPWASPKTVASGIQDPLVGYSQDGTLTLNVVRKSDGLAVATSDEAILQGVRLMSQLEGLYVEPTVGAALAAVPGLVHSGTIRENDEVVIVSTGHGLKQPFASQDEISALPEIEPTLESLQALKLS